MRDQSLTKRPTEGDNGPETFRPQKYADFPRTCSTPGCGKSAKPDRLRCSACHQRAFRERHPVRAALCTLTDHARARGIPVDLSPEEWAEFCRITGYIEKKGPNAGNLTVDRWDAEDGYNAVNIRPLTRSQNSVKWNVTDRPRRFAAQPWMLPL